MQADFALALSRRDRLRKEVEALHHTIDAQISHAGFLSSRRGYNAYLLATLQARGGIEAALQANGAARHYPAWPRRRITPALESDAADLGLDVSASEAAGRRPAQVLGVGAVWGALYVLEGSSLGARLLQRRVLDIGMTPFF